MRYFSSCIRTRTDLSFRGRLLRGAHHVARRKDHLLEFVDESSDLSILILDAWNGQIDEFVGLALVQRCGFDIPPESLQGGILESVRTVFELQATNDALEQFDLVVASTCRIVLGQLPHVVGIGQIVNVKAVRCDAIVLHLLVQLFGLGNESD